MLWSSCFSQCSFWGSETPLKIVSRLNPITKALLPPSRLTVLQMGISSVFLHAYLVELPVSVRVGTHLAGSASRREGAQLDYQCYQAAKQITRQQWQRLGLNHWHLPFMELLQRGRPKWSHRYTIGAKMITCRKNCFEQLIFELHCITVHLLSFAQNNFRLSCNGVPLLREKRGTTRESVYITLPDGGLPAN